MEIFLGIVLKYLLPALAILAAGFGFRSSAKAKAETKAKEVQLENLRQANAARMAEAKATITHQQELNLTTSEVQHEVTKLDTGAATDKLHDKWSRD